MTTSQRLHRGNSEAADAPSLHVQDHDVLLADGIAGTFADGLDSRLVQIAHSANVKDQGQYDQCDGLRHEGQP